MFSVDNFYTIFNSYYGNPKKNNALLWFYPHGSKAWNSLSAWGKNNSDTWFIGQGVFLMHDQEPFSFNEIQEFKKFVCSPECLETAPTPEIYRYLKGLAEIAEFTDDITFAHLAVKTTKVPIICHSEKNSQDIKKLTDNHWVECYYWWHGMIARDWFRHWQRHSDLTVCNKSQTQHRFLIYSRATDGTRTYRTEIIDYLKKYQHTVNYNWNNSARCPTLSATIDVDDANNSAIHLIAETLFDTEKIYLTEKVFKPMVMCQPFILFGPPGSLQYLRDYGFKTFGQFWDESYDLVTDAASRKQCILELVDNLANLSSKEFECLYDQLLPIIAHNKKHFYSNEFQDILWSEMQTNCSDALLKQQELSEQLPGGTYLHYINKFAEQNSFIRDLWKSTIPTVVDQCNIRSQFSEEYPALAKLI